MNFFNRTPGGPAQFHGPQRGPMPCPGYGPGLHHPHCPAGQGGWWHPPGQDAVMPYGQQPLQQPGQMEGYGGMMSNPMPGVQGMDQWSAENNIAENWQQHNHANNMPGMDPNMHMNHTPPMQNHGQHGMPESGYVPGEHDDDFD